MSEQEPTRQRPGDQVLPSGDESAVDDQALLIADIEERRQLGISRYGQGHRPFNGRDTLQDLYEEQLDLLVYLRSIVRMADATTEELYGVIKAALEDGHYPVNSDMAHEQATDVLAKIQGWIAANILEKEG